jgi:hypothetical protein
MGKLDGKVAVITGGQMGRPDEIAAAPGKPSRNVKGPRPP